MDNTLKMLNKQIKELETKKQKHILEKKKEKHAEKEIEKIRKQVESILNEKDYNKNRIYDDLDELFCSLHSFYKRNYDAESSYLKYELGELLDKTIHDTQNQLDDTVKSKTAFIESLKELKEQYEDKE